MKPSVSTAGTPTSTACVNCHLQVHTLGFIQPLTELVLVANNYNNEPQASTSMFKVRFQLTRISKVTSQKNGGNVDVVYFSSLKQITSELNIANYYLIGVT